MALAFGTFFCEDVPAMTLGPLKPTTGSTSKAFSGTTISF
jgi:hypothetical protein